MGVIRGCCQTKERSVSMERAERRVKDLWISKDQVNQCQGVSGDKSEQGMITGHFLGMRKEFTKSLNILMANDYGWPDLLKPVDKEYQGNSR